MRSYEGILFHVQVVYDFFMRKYIHLIRLEDQYIQFGAAVAAGIYLKVQSWEIIYWAMACTLLSFSAFIVNEITDRKDTDRFSWNPVHAHYKDDLNARIVWAMFWVSAIGGLGIAAVLGLFWWGIVLFIVGVLYSLEPVRFKRRFAWDMLAQLVVWWIVPFMAPVWGRVDPITLIVFVVATTFLFAAAGFPYQLADFAADQKALLRNTHVTLGLPKSLVVGQAMGIVGIVLFFSFGLYQSELWAWPLVAFGAAAVWWFHRWYRMGHEAKQLTSMQNFVRIAQPVSRLLIPYVLIIWLW